MWPMPSSLLCSQRRRRMMGRKFGFKSSSAIPKLPYLALLTNLTNRFSLLKVSGIFGPSLAVAVPSRLYFQKSPSKPLSGMRIVVKDNFDVKGIHTVVSNKSFLKFRADASQTAPVVSELLAKGAVLIGKVKMTSFADREYPPIRLGRLPLSVQPEG